MSTTRCCGGTGGQLLRRLRNSSNARSKPGRLAPRRDGDVRGQVGQVGLVGLVEESRQPALPALPDPPELPDLPCRECQYHFLPAAGLAISFLYSSISVGTQNISL